MKLLTKDRKELADVSLSAPKGKPLVATINACGKTITAPGVELELTKEGTDLVAHVRIPGMVNFNVAVEPGDMSALKGLMSKDVLKFVMSTLFK